MSLLRIVEVNALDGFRLRLTLSNGSSVVRDVEALLIGPAFDEVRSNTHVFGAARAEAGTVTWPNGADLCPDVLIWGGIPPQDEERQPPPQRLAPAALGSLDSRDGSLAADHSKQVTTVLRKKHSDDR